MPHPFNITVQNRKTGAKATIAGEFPDAEWKILTQFLSYSKELGATGIIRDRRTISYTFNWNRDEGSSHEAILPTDDEISAFLHRLRPFVLENEPTFAPRTISILARFLALPEIRSVLDLQRDRFFRRLEGDLRIATDDAEITSHDTAMKWLNAFEYHRDGDKQAEIRKLTEVFPEPSTRAIFLTTMYDKAQTVFDIAAMIRGLTDRGGAETVMHSKG